MKERLLQVISVATQVAVSWRVHRYRLALQARQEAGVREARPRAGERYKNGRALSGTAKGGSALESGFGLEVNLMYLLLTEKAYVAFGVCLVSFIVGLLQGRAVVVNVGTICLCMRVRACVASHRVMSVCFLSVPLCIFYRLPPLTIYKLGTCAPHIFPL